MESSETFRLRYAQAIRSARLALNLDQTDFAVMNGVGLRTLQGWEAGRSLPQPRHRRKLDKIIKHAEQKVETITKVANGG